MPGVASSENRWDNWPQVIRFVCEQILKKVHTAVPGIVDAYNPATRRAIVQPATDITLTDNATRSRAILLDIPVLWPGGGGWFVHAPLRRGDAVLIVTSERDISAFKQTNQQGPLPTTRVMSEADGVAIPMFTPPDGDAPAVLDGITLQSGDGSTRITLQDGAVEIVADTITLRYTGGTTTYP